MNQRISSADLWKGRLLVVIASILWSTNGWFVKLLLKSGMEGPTIAGYRTFWASVALVGAALALRRPVRFKPVAGSIMVLCFATMNYVFVSAMALTTAANALFLQYTGPLWMVVLCATVLREPLQTRSLVSVIVGAIAVVVIVVGNWTPAADARLGLTYGVFAGLLFAGVAVSMRSLKNEDPLWLAAFNNLGAFLFVAAILAAGSSEKLTEQLMIPIREPIWMLPAAAFGIVQLGIPYVLFGRGLKYVSPQEAGLIGLLEAVLCPIWTYLGYGETVSTMTMVGGALLLFAVALRYVPSPQRRATTVD